MQRDYTPHFITFCTKFRRILPDWARDIVLGCCLHDHERRYRLRAAVVMPDHVHLLLTPLIDESRRAIVSLAEIMKAIKGASSHAINRKNGNTSRSGRKNHSMASFDPPRISTPRSRTSLRIQ
jgi:REP element-mobilizing transposase RayT